MENTTERDKQLIIAKMIAAKEFKEGVTSIEWLDLASGIHDIELTKKLVERQKVDPIYVRWDSGEGYVEVE